MSFLTAHSKNLIMVNYEVLPDLLLPYVPVGTELDFYQGKCYVSLVGFLFDETRLLGIPVPFHKTFEEVNLRFYVKRFEAGAWKIGVVFVKEIVPRFMITAVANVVYGEHYEYCRMSHSFVRRDDHTVMEYGWDKYSMKAIVSNHVKNLSPGSLEEFIAEHYWGYTKLSRNETGEYQVVHPSWKTFDLKSYEVDCDFEGLYGENFGVLNSQAPASVFVAQGSAVEVRRRRIIK